MVKKNFKKMYTGCPFKNVDRVSLEKGHYRNCYILFLIIIVSPYVIIVAQVFIGKVYPKQNAGDYTVETQKKTTFILKLINYAMPSS